MHICRTAESMIVGCQNWFRCRQDWPSQTPLESPLSTNSVGRMPSWGGWKCHQANGEMLGRRSSWKARYYRCQKANSPA